MTATLVLVLRIGLAVVLYAFLWRVLQTLWQDLKQQGVVISSRKPPGIHIDVQTENGGEYRFQFQQAGIVIGRGSHCDISLTDKALSARHARLSFHHAQWWLEDMDSTNGTFLNHGRVTVPTVIISGDQFKCGDTTFHIQIEGMEAQFTKAENSSGGSR